MSQAVHEAIELGDLPEERIGTVYSPLHRFMSSSHPFLDVQVQLATSLSQLKVKIRRESPSPSLPIAPGPSSPYI